MVKEHQANSATFHNLFPRCNKTHSSVYKNRSTYTYDDTRCENYKATAHIPAPFKTLMLCFTTQLHSPAVVGEWLLLSLTHSHM